MAGHRSRSRSADSKTSPEFKRRKYEDDDQGADKRSSKDGARDSKDRSSSKRHRSERDRDSSRRDRSKERSRHSRDTRDRHRDRDGDRERRDDRESAHAASSFPPRGNGRDVHQNEQTVRSEGRTSHRPSSDALDNGRVDQRQQSNGQIHSTGRTDLASTQSSAKKEDLKAEGGTSKVTTAATDAEEKLRQRREKIEQWRRERLAKEAAEKGGAENATASPGSPVVSSPAVKPEAQKAELQPVSRVPLSAAKPHAGKAPLAKVAPKISFVKPGRIGISMKPTSFGKGPSVNSRPSAFGLDDDDDTPKMSTLPGRKLRIAGPDDMDTEETAPVPDDGGEDTLDAFMADVSTEVQRLNDEDLQTQQQNQSTTPMDVVEGDDQAEDDGDQSDTPEDLIAAAAKKLAAKRKDLAPVDHSTQSYEQFRKDFYIEPPELADMTPEEVDAKRIELDGIKIRGVKCPKPIEKWTQFGLPGGVGDVIRKVLKYEKPSSIQAQAIPAIMSGRDVIGIAKTGSGKTIAFLLPMFRHIKDQRPLEPQEGPVALIMTPTRELAVQIHKECKYFAKVLNLRAVCCYGGSPIKDQIAELKRGAEIIICTPGRMIDLLCANSGRVTNLKRVTYLVLDEADRMFDMGFEPQVMRIVNNVRPSRQTILFSATFPRKMEALARKILKKPLEITVGGRSVVASDVTQIVEVLQDDNAKFLRLLEILGKTFHEDDGAKILIFTDRQEAADNLLTQLLRKGYPCQSLHGGKDQADRDTTITDYKTGNTNILIATSVAARGLDVKQLKVVINYECPNHMEDYVHRVGRTGRAGNKGTAYTFITPEQDRFAVDIMKALTMSEVPIPDDLQKLSDAFMEKVKAGAAQFSSSGFGGKGLEKLEKERDIVKRIQKKAHGGQYEEEEEEEEEEKEVKFEAKAVPSGAAPPRETAAPAATNATGGDPRFKAAEEAAAKVNASIGATGTARALDIIAEINAKAKAGNAGLPGFGGASEDKKQSAEAAFAYEIEINDYPKKARWRVTNKEQISQINELSGAAITTRGTFFPPGKQPGPGERKLYLFIEGDTQLVIDKAKVEIRRIITEATISSMESEAAGGARYSVV
ncbi:ATP-dependent RNA helicase Prp11 [Fimicolochytrium jonesii]|uniref:ATP-dependent RNA helicase Prp11 n=1 Tax=Fimicolochytrium jonesii TaxID=1396493 RepID=UPI0022FF213D|nr:ATP-dependent RNA helicase Prp11 [Fimicolochytrium jonesii]KAI8817396.1 ATP-dependent RNA helicase Prp11 [Fimicolochytrium jonesii]